jgi:sodium pump decarboxylase gamma subunit
MKHIFKKISAVCTAAFCAMIITVAGCAVVFADTEIDESIKSQLIATAESLTDTIILLSDEDIQNYMSSSDSFTVSAMEAWDSSKDELGEKSETQDAGESEVVYSDNEFTVTIPVSFENADAEFVYVFDSTGTPTSLTVDVDLPMSVNLQRAALNTVMGIGTVFIMLIFLSFVISLFKYIPNPDSKKKAAAPAPAPVAPVPAVAAEETDDTELIAVIAAAIAASEGTSPDGFVVRSIRKVNRGRR